MNEQYILERLNELYEKWRGDSDRSIENFLSEIEESLCGI